MDFSLVFFWADSGLTRPRKAAANIPLLVRVEMPQHDLHPRDLRQPPSCRPMQGLGLSGGKFLDKPK
jgi:hypothetical protein